MAIITDIEDKHIQGFELEDRIHDGENVIGCFYKNTGIINLINIHKQYDNYKGKDITIEGFGKWHIDDIVPKQEQISSQLKLFDLSYKFDTEYKLLSDDIFPCTVLAWAQAICTDVGVQLGSTSFPNSDFVLNEQPYLPEKATNRDAMKVIAGAAACFVKIENDEKVYFKWFENTTVEIEDWFELTQDIETKPVNVVVLGRGDVEDNIKYPTVTPENPVELRIDDNQILYFNREEMIVPIYNQVNSFKFFPFKMRTNGRALLKSGMKVKYTDIDGLEITTYVMYHKITYNGGTGANKSYSSNIEAYELKETSTKYEYAGSIEKRVTNAERICDKNNNEIKDIVEQQTEINDKLVEYNQDLEGFRFKIEEAGGINLIKNSTLEDGLNLYHTTTGTLTIEKNMDIKENTTSKTAVKIIEGSIATENINIIAGQEYTFSCLIYKTELTNVKVRVITDIIKEYVVEIEPKTWQKFTANFNSSVNTVMIEIIADNNFCYISDMILNKGDTALGWQRHAGEFRSDTVIINELGITVENSTDNVKHVMTASENKIINTLNGKTTVTFNADKTIMTSVDIQEKATKGKVRETVRDDGTVMVTMDD